MFVPDTHFSQIGGGGEHWLVVDPLAPVAPPMCTQQDRHIAPRPAAASGCRHGGGAHDVAPVAPVAHCPWTEAQMQPKIAERPRIVGCVPPIPVLPVVPVEPVAGHGLHAVDAIPPRRPKSRAMLVGGPGHGWQSSQATRTEELTIPLAPDRHGGRWQRSSGRIRASGITGEPVEPLEPVAPLEPLEPVALPGGHGLQSSKVGISVVEPLEPVEPPSGHGLQRSIVGISVVEPLEPVEPPSGHGLQRANVGISTDGPVEPVAPPGGHVLHATRRTILCQRRRIGCPA